MVKYGFYVFFILAAALAAPGQAVGNMASQDKAILGQSADYLLADNDRTDRRRHNENRHDRDFRPDRDGHRPDDRGWDRGDRNDKRDRKWKRGDREDRPDRFDRKRPDDRFRDDGRRPPRGDHPNNMGRPDHHPGEGMPGNPPHRPGMNMPNNGGPEFPGRR